MLPPAEAVTRKVEPFPEAANAPSVIPPENEDVPLGVLTALISQWRREWNQGDFPFYLVQLANYEAPGSGPKNWAWLREAQARTLAVPNTGMAVAIDVGNPKDLHPRNKQEVGRRLALIALAKTYGKPIGEFSGPVYSKTEPADGGALRIHFGHSAGLKSKDAALPGFEIAGEDRKFMPAEAKIDGETVLVSSPSVPKPVAVRYAWDNSPLTSLFNGADLPAAPFRTDDWPRE